MDEHTPQSQPTNSQTTNSKPPAIGASTFIIVLVISAALAGGLYWFIMGSDNQANTGLEDGFEIGALGNGDDANAPALVPRDELPDVVAEVNGTAISKETMISNIEFTEAQLAQQGGDFSDAAIQAQIQQQALDQAINNELLKQAAAAAGVVVSEAEVEAEYQQVQSQFTDEAAFNAELENSNLTTAELRANIEDQLTINAYLAGSEAITNLPAVTEAEALALYDQFAAQGGAEVPAFEDVRDQIEARIMQQNEQLAVSELITALRNEAEVEIFF